MKAETAIALGSNIGDAEGHVREAFNRLDILLDDAKLSQLYATAPLYRKDQDWFVNAVVLGKTDLSPQALLQEIKSIEKLMGRLETYRNGPRLIDLDLLFYDDVIVKEDDLQVPHPRLAERLFVLCPLHDLKPDWVHPVTKRSISAMIESAPKEDLYALAK